MESSHRPEYLAQHGTSSALLRLEEIEEDLSLLCRLIYDISQLQTEDNDHTLSGLVQDEPLRSYPILPLPLHPHYDSKGCSMISYPLPLRPWIPCGMFQQPGSFLAK